MVSRSQENIDIRITTNAGQAAKQVRAVNIGLTDMVGNIKSLIIPFTAASLVGATLGRVFTQQAWAIAFAREEFHALFVEMERLGIAVLSHFADALAPAAEELGKVIHEVNEFDPQDLEERRKALEAFLEGPSEEATAGENWSNFINGIRAAWVGLDTWLEENNPLRDALKDFEWPTIKAPKLGFTWLVLRARLKNTFDWIQVLIKKAAEKLIPDIKINPPDLLKAAWDGLLNRIRERVNQIIALINSAIGAANALIPGGDPIPNVPALQDPDDPRGNPPYRGLVPGEDPNTPTAGATSQPVEVNVVVEPDDGDKRGRDVTVRSTTPGGFLAQFGSAIGNIRIGGG